MNPNNENAPSHAADLKSTKASIQQQSSDLQLAIDMSRVKIVNLCGEVVNEIDIVTETRILELNSLRAEKIAKVRTYEQECLANWALVEDTLRATVKEAKDFVIKWLPDNDSSMNNATGNLVEIEEKASQQLVQLSELSQELEAIQFSGRRLTFEENKLAKVSDHSLIGSLVIENLNLAESFQANLRDRNNTSLSISKC
jgi:hypothetical protein